MHHLIQTYLKLLIKSITRKQVVYPPLLLFIKIHLQLCSSRKLVNDYGHFCKLVVITILQHLHKIDAGSQLSLLL